MDTKESIEVTCPECRGPLSMHRIGPLLEFRCMVGHSYSPRSVLEAQAEAEERVLWAAVVALRETGVLVEALASTVSPELLDKLRVQVRKKSAQADLIQAILEQLEPFAD